MRRERIAVLDGPTTKDIGLEGRKEIYSFEFNANCPICRQRGWMKVGFQNFQQVADFARSLPEEIDAEEFNQLCVDSLFYDCVVTFECGTHFEHKIEISSMEFDARTIRKETWRNFHRAILDHFFVYEPDDTTPTKNKEQPVNTPTTVDVKSFLTTLATDMGHGAQVGGAIEARQFVMDIFYGSLGGREKAPTWLAFVPERVLAVLVSVGLYFIATFVWTTMPFASQVAYACRLCWEADGRDLVQPYAARLRLAIEKVGPQLPKPPDTESAS